MSTSRSLLPLALVSLGGAVILPVLMSTMFTMWRAKVEAHQPTRAEVEEALKLQEQHEQAAAAPAPPAEPVYERPVDEVMFVDFPEVVMDEPEQRDVTPDQPFRIDLVRGPNGLAGVARVDLDRDGRVDEVWHLPAYDRDSDPGPDGTFTKHWRWEGHWVPAEAPAGG